MVSPQDPSTDPNCALLDTGPSEEKAKEDHQAQRVQRACAQASKAGLFPRLDRVRQPGGYACSPLPIPAIGPVARGTSTADLITRRRRASNHSAVEVPGAMEPMTRIDDLGESGLGVEKQLVSY